MSTINIHFKDQMNSSDEQCEEEEEDEEEDDLYFDEGDNPAKMAISSEKNSVQTNISNNGSGGTLSMRNTKSVSKKSKPVVNVRPDFMLFFLLSCIFFHV